MAIQMRRGDYADFDPTKLVAGELAVVTSGDPNSDTGRALYICFEPGIVKRVTDYEDLIDQINAATQEIQQRFTASVEQSARDALSFAESASSSAGTASSASESATAASQSASSAQAAAESAAAAAKDAKEYVDQHGTKPMTGATATATGTAGTVPAPQAGTSTRFLCSDATWKEAVDATQGKAINDAIAKNAADIATNKSGISKNKADITALNSSLSRYKFMRYERTCNNDLYVTVVPPSTGYRPAAASADWTDLQKRIRSVSWQDGINKAVVWFDDYVTGTLGFTILWVKGYD